jgi:hypothetical protein
VHRDRDVVAESMVVQDIDSEEQCDIDKPPTNRYSIKLKEQRRSGHFKLGYVARGRDKDKLHKGE